MGATQHWLKTDIVNDEELRMIRTQVFEAIQRKRSELHREAAAVLRAERWVSMCNMGCFEAGSSLSYEAFFWLLAYAAFFFSSFFRFCGDSLSGFFYTFCGLQARD